VRRQEKEILDRNELEAVSYEARVCRVGMSDGRYPDFVPRCFGHADDPLYFRSNTRRQLKTRPSSSACASVA